MWSRLHKGGRAKHVYRNQLVQLEMNGREIGIDVSFRRGRLTDGWITLEEGLVDGVYRLLCCTNAPVHLVFTFRPEICKGVIKSYRWLPGQELTINTIFYYSLGIPTRRRDCGESVFLFWTPRRSIVFSSIVLVIYKHILFFLVKKNRIKNADGN